VPALLLGGTADLVTTLRHNQFLNRLIPGSRVVTLDGVGHHLFAEAPEACLAEVTRFLREGGAR
jgi:pimeloyl-ACP methyl ester carboxylesterase